MRNLSPRLFVTLATFVLVVFEGAGTPLESEHWLRLESMPRERRNALAGRIRAFDSLPRDKQDAIRAIDENLAAESPEARENDLTVLRRYHLWLRRLPESQRDELVALSTEPKLKLVEKLYAEERSTRTRRLPYFVIAEFGSVSPFVLADQIKVWFALSEPQKETIRKLNEPERLRKLSQFANDLKVDPVKKPSPQATESLLAHVSKTRLYPFVKKFEDAKKDESVKARLLDHYYFLENRPKPARPEKILQFDDSLPFWIRSSFDTLPPDEARRRLTILYRLVFPDGEMPDAKTKAAQSPAPSAKPAVNATVPASPGPAANPSSPY